ncbi:MAG: MiaB/RimO family radical SAM methylthiotransferase [Chloroflexota bacterium]
MRVYLDTIGCRLNQAEVESMARQFRAAGHEIVEAAEFADIAVVNTCSVTAEAASDSRSKIRRLGRLGKAEIVATGCWATLRPGQAADLPRVRGVVPNELKDRLVGDVLQIPAQAFEAEPARRVPLPGRRRRTRAFIKVQDGCNNHCTFCVTTIARGESRSRSLTEIVADVQAALRGGTKEIVLTGVHLGSWGQDLRLHVKDLVRGILRETDARRVRLSSLEPWDLDAGFFELWEDQRLCRHFHLPLQSGCAATLRRMARRTTPAAFKALVAAAREVVPDAAVTTDVIAGFPAETEREFCDSLDFVRDMQFAGGHAFTFSPMTGTAARGMRDQVPVEERRRRNRMYMAAFDEAARAFRLRHAGQKRTVLWESATRAGEGTWQLSGLTDNYIRVKAEAAVNRWNEIDEVALGDDAGDGLLGIITKTG